MDNTEFPPKTTTEEDSSISVRIESQAEPQQPEGDYRLVVESASQGIVIAQEDTIRYANPKITEYTGYTREELVSRPFIELIHPDDRQMVIRQHQDVLSRKAPSGRLTHRIIDKEGRIRWMEVTGVPFTWEDTASTLLFINDITERKEIEDRLRESEERYRDLIENTGDLIYVMDGNGNFKLVNQTIEHEYGYTTSELLGKGFTNIITPESYKLAADIFKKQLKGIDVGNFEYDLYDKNGQIKTIETKERLVWEGDRVVEIYGIARDVTDRKRVQAALQESEEKYRSLVENLNDVICSTDTEGRVTYVSPVVEQIIGYPVQEIVGHPITDFIYSADLPLFMESYKRTISGQKEPLEFRAIHKNGSIIHVRTFSRRQFHNGTLVGLTGTITDITERVKAEDSLRESEEKYRLVVENADEGIIIAKATHIKFVNPKVVKELGYTEEELTSRPFIELIHPEDREMVIHHHLEGILGNKVAPTITYRIFDRSRAMRWIEVNGVRIIWEGEPCALLFVKDISDRKRAEKALKESEEKYRMVVENAGEGIAIVGKDSFCYVNPTMTEYTGYTREELRGRSFVDLIHPDDRKEFLEAHRGLLSNNAETAHVTHRFIDRDGNARWAEDTAVPIMWEGDRAVLVFVKDVTERKRIEDALTESEEKYRLVVENAGEIITVATDGILQFINRRAIELSGYQEDELLSTPVIDRVHPDDRQLLLEHRKKRERGEKAIRPLIMRLITKDGNIIWTENSVVPVLWQGKPAALNIATDITERKRIEDALRESEEKYRTVVENANEIIVITQDGFVEFANKGVMTLFGIPPEALIGKHLSDLVIKSDRDRLREEYRKLVSGEEVLPFYRYRMRDGKGKIRFIEVNGIVITWDGHPSVLSFVSDITEKVLAEQEIERRLRYEQAMALCSQELVGLNDLDTAIHAIVEHLLKILDVGGVFVCKNVMDPVDGLSMLTVSEAVAEGHRPALSFPIPDKLAYKYRSKEMLDALSNGRWFGGPTKDYPPVDRDLLALIGSLSSITIPISVDGTFWGFIGFEDYQTGREWNEQDILLLQTLSSMIGTIIARKEAQTALTESEQRYRELVDNTSDIIYVTDFKGYFKFVNNAVRQLGYEPDEILRRNINEFYAPSSEKYAQELFRIQRTGTQLRGYELDFVRKDGQVRTIEFRDELKWEGNQITEVRGIGRDVTDRKKMEDRLRLVAGSQEAVLNSLPDMVFFADSAMKITWVNRAASGLTGFSAEELVGRFCYDVLHQKKAPCEACPAVISLTTGRLEKNDSMPYLGKNRRVTAYPVPDISGSITGIAVSIGSIRSRHFLDISESFSHLDDDIEADNTSELFLAPLDPNYIYPFSLSIDLEKDTFNITLRWDEYSKEHLLKRLARSESAVARFIYLAARMKTDGTGWVDKDIIRAGTMDTNLNKLRSLLEESNVPFLDRFSSRMLIRSNKEEKKKVRLALSASNIEITPAIKNFQSKKHRYMAAVSKKIKSLEREMGKSNQHKEYLISELTIQRQNETNLRKSIEVVETLIGESAILLKF
jgi:PAS domain S-box-containing protein